MLPPAPSASPRIPQFRREKALLRRDYVYNQRERFGRKGEVRCNARTSPKQIKAHIQLDEAGEGMMQMAMTELNLSAPAYDRIRKVSRTIAHLAGSEQVQAEYDAEAIQYRTLDRGMWG